MQKDNNEKIEAINLELERLIEENELKQAAIVMGIALANNLEINFKCVIDFGMAHNIDGTEQLIKKYLQLYFLSDKYPTDTLDLLYKIFDHAFRNNIAHDVIIESATLYFQQFEKIDDINYSDELEHIIIISSRLIFDLDSPREALDFLKIEKLSGVTSIQKLRDLWETDGISLTKIDDLELTTNTYVRLRRAGIYHLEEIKCLTKNELQNFRFFNANCIEEIEKWLD